MFQRPFLLFSCFLTAEGDDGSCAMHGIETRSLAGLLARQKRNNAPLAEHSQSFSFYPAP